MKPIRLQKILKNLRKGQVNKNNKWEKVNPEIVERIKIYLAFAKYQVVYYNEENRKRGFTKKREAAKSNVVSYTQILARLT